MSPLAESVGSPPADRLAFLAGLDLQTASMADLQAAMAAGLLTSVQLTQAYLDRIATLDCRVNAVRELDPTALEQAARLDDERATGPVRGPLHGLPVLLKDNIGTAGLATTAGSLALEGSVPERDAHVTRRLRAAGAVVLGKTNLSEFANWMDPSMPNGYSSLGGQVLEAYTYGDPSGSSSGAGVAASMAFAAGTLGSETSGSILSPSSVNGLVGVKPTRGLVSRAGIVPLAEGFDTAGPMTRCVADAAALLTVIAGTDPADPATAEASAHATDYVAALAGATLQGVRLGFSPRQLAELSAEDAEVHSAALSDLRRRGAVLVETEVVQDGLLAGEAEIDLIPNDFKAHLNRYLATEIPVPPSGVRTLSDVVAFNAQHLDRVKYGQSLLEQSDATPGDADAAAADALALRTQLAALVDRALAQDDLVALVAPGSSYSNAGAAAGYPSVVVPAGLVDGRLPMGVSFLGTAWSEVALLRVAVAYEAGTQRRVPPTQVNEALLSAG